MRSELVYEAGRKIENHFLLAATAMRAVRKVHVNSARTEETVNRVFIEVAKGRCAHGELPKVTRRRAVDLLLIKPAA
jgi:hypothetical protein